MKPSVPARAVVWTAAVSATAAGVHVGLTALGVAVAKEVFDLLRARSHRTTTLAVMQAAKQGMNLEVGQSGEALTTSLRYTPPVLGHLDAEEVLYVSEDSDERSSAAAMRYRDHVYIAARKELMAYARSQTTNWTDAEDAVSYAIEKSLNYHTKNGRLSPPKFDEPIAWMKRIVSNRLKDGWRRNTVLRRKLSKLISPDPGDFTEDVHDRILAGQAEEFIASLKPRDHIIASMYYGKGLAPKEIAEILELSSGTVRSTLFRVKGAMRAQLGLSPESGIAPEEDS
jgi:RNA polymerase sigma factor (sigma-70 family)